MNEFILSFFDPSIIVRTHAHAPLTPETASIQPHKRSQVSNMMFVLGGVM